MARKMRLALSRRQANPPASAAYFLLGLLLLAGSWVFGQALGTLANSLALPALTTYGGFAALAAGWWYLPRARAAQLIIGLPTLLVLAVAAFLTTLAAVDELIGFFAGEPAAP